jgi:hypothetical protein
MFKWYQLRYWKSSQSIGLGWGNLFNIELVYNKSIWIRWQYKLLPVTKEQETWTWKKYFWQFEKFFWIKL